MRALTVSLLAVGAAVAVSACHPVERHHEHQHRHGFWEGDNHWDWGRDDDRTVSVGATLECPESEGDLTRTAQAADGKSCQYHGDEDQDVTLSLLDLNGQGPAAALQPKEAQLAALVPAPPSGGSAVNIDTSSGPGSDHAKIDVPGFHIDANGDKAKIKILGTTIDADGDNADVKTSMGGMKNAVIHAGPGGAQIRAGNVGQHSADLVYILAGDNPGPSGYRAVGYIARGPVAGPLVVGEFRSRENRHNDRPDHDLQRLIDLNVK